MGRGRFCLFRAASVVVELSSFANRRCERTSRAQRAPGNPNPPGPRTRDRPPPLARAARSFPAFLRNPASPSPPPDRPSHFCPHFFSRVLSRAPWPAPSTLAAPGPLPFFFLFLMQRPLPPPFSAAPFFFLPLFSGASRASSRPTTRSSPLPRPQPSLRVVFCAACTREGKEEEEGGGKPRRAGTREGDGELRRAGRGEKRGGAGGPEGGRRTCFERE